ncbi:hypothetical protein RRG08_038439 [Elysia crispata]|uniref:Carboxylesterase type B domain-containing protein n=1 Tax=Elysia crispata TaxID=231223 RepID=A0AAE1AMG8_9GAST|nr:hypothetical protein RRG08_038439 [Elysia crispata]
MDPLVFLLSTLLAFSPSVVAAPDLRFSYGTVRGVDKAALGTGKLYYAYFGIPFAEPPVGSLRFKPPVPYIGTGRADTVITIDDYSRGCMQNPPPLEGEMGEDCLYLTVFTPPQTSISSGEKKVMVWIHGGGFTSGLSRGYDPGRLVTDSDVIVVSVQYRLGMLGFLSSGDDVIPGNMGLRDQLLALKWVKDNIRRFGGDPDDVTVFGESAGGASVSFLALSPQANGLFTKGVMMSGTAMAGWALVRDPESVFISTARALGCLPWFYLPGNKSIKSCLERKDAASLTYEPKLSKTDIYTKSESSYVLYAPVVDGDIVPRNPKSLVQDDQYLQRHGVLERSYVVGFTNQEGLTVVDYILSTPGASFEQLVAPSNVAALVKSVVEDEFSLKATQSVLNVADFIYTFPRNPDGSVPYQAVADLTSDAGYVIPSMQFVQAIAEKCPVYLYVFDHYPELKDPEFPVQGTSHGMDLLFFFDFPPEFGKFLSSYANVYTPEAEPLPGIYRDALASFAKSKNPGIGTNSVVSSDSLSWPRYSQAQQNYLAISTQPEVRRNVYAQRVALWTDFLPKLTAQSSFFSRPRRKFGDEISIYKIDVKQRAMATHGGSPEIWIDPGEYSCIPFVYTLEQDVACLDMAGETSKPPSDEDMHDEGHEEKKLLALLQKQQEQQQNELLKKWFQLKKKEIPIKDRHQLSGLRPKHNRMGIELSCGETGQEKRSQCKRFQSDPLLQCQTRRPCVQHQQQVLGEQTAGKRSLSKSPNGHDKIQTDPILAMEGFHDANTKSTRYEFRGKETQVSINIKDKHGRLKSHQVGDKLTLFSEQEKLLHDFQGMFQPYLQDQQLTEQLDEQNRAFDLKEQRFAPPLRQHSYPIDKNLTEDNCKVGRKRLLPRYKRNFAKLNRSEMYRPAEIINSQHMPADNIYSVSPESGGIVLASDDCDQDIKIKDGGETKEDKHVERKISNLNWIPEHLLAASDLEYPSLKVYYKTSPVIEHQEYQLAETLLDEHRNLSNQGAAFLHSRTRPLSFKHLKQSSECNALDLFQSSPRRKPRRSASMLCLNSCQKKHGQQWQQPQRYHEPDEKDPTELTCKLGLWESDVISVIQNLSEGVLEPREGYSCKGKKRKSNEDQLQNALLLDAKSVEKSDHVHDVSPGRTWCPPPQLEQSVHPDLHASDVNSEVALSKIRHCFLKQSTSPIGLPLGQISRFSKLHETEKSKSETPQSESFKTGPLRTKLILPKPQRSFQNDKKQNQQNDDILKDKRCTHQIFVRGSNLWPQSRQSNPCSQDKILPKTGSNAVEAGYIHEPSQQQRTPLGDQHRNRSKSKALGQRRSISRSTKARDQSPTRAVVCRARHLQANKEQRSLSAGRTDPDGKAPSLTRTTLKRPTVAGRKQWELKSSPAAHSHSTGRSKAFGRVDDRPKSPVAATKTHLSKKRADNLREGAGSHHPSLKSDGESQRIRGCLNPSEELGDWSECNLHQTTSSMNDPLHGLTHKVPGRDQFCHFGVDHLRKHLRPEFRAEMATDALMRLHYLPCSLRSLNRRDIGAFESMSLPLVCIDRDASLSRFGAQVNMLDGPSQPPFKEQNAADNKSVITPAHTGGLLADQTDNAQTQYVCFRDALSLRNSVLKDGACVKDTSTAAAGTPTINSCPDDTGLLQRKDRKSSVPKLTKEGGPERCNDSKGSSAHFLSDQHASLGPASYAAESWIKRRASIAMALRLSAGGSHAITGSLANSSARLAKRETNGRIDPTRADRRVGEGDSAETMPAAVTDKSRPARSVSVSENCSPEGSLEDDTTISSYSESRELRGSAGSTSLCWEKYWELAALIRSATGYASNLRWFNRTGLLLLILGLTLLLLLWLL